jgi:TM2 domain-containing membrane protein YozV
MTSRAFASMILALLVPGAGHFYLGRRVLAAAFCAIGLGVDGALYTLPESRGSLLSLLATAGSMGSGALYFLARSLGPHGTISSSTYEYGRMFTLTAGLMNLLLVLDCYDIAIGRKP